MTTALPPLSDEDREALRETARNLNDIPAATRARIDAGFERAYRVAEQIRQGQRDPLR
jgi:hypothetical protein